MRAAVMIDAPELVPFYAYPLYCRTQSCNAFPTVIIIILSLVISAFSECFRELIMVNILMTERQTKFLFSFLVLASTHFSYIQDMTNLWQWLWQFIYGLRSCKENFFSIFLTASKTTTKCHTCFKSRNLIFGQLLILISMLSIPNFYLI